MALSHLGHVPRHGQPYLEVARSIQINVSKIYRERLRKCGDDPAFPLSHVWHIATTFDMRRLGKELLKHLA